MKNKKKISIYTFIFVLCISSLFIALKYRHSPFKYTWAGCELTLPDRSFKKLMSGDSSVLGFESKKWGTVDIVRFSKEESSRVIHFPEKKEEVKLLWENKNMGTEYDILSFHTPENGEKKYEAILSISQSVFQYALISGISHNDTVYQITILMKENNEENKKISEDIMNSFLIQ